MDPFTLSALAALVAIGFFGAARGGGGSRPRWPLQGSGRTFRDTFGDPRPNSRRHAGVDIYGRAGELVYAPEAGTVVRVSHTFNVTNGAVMIAMARNVILLGELEPMVSVGERVRAGQVVGALEPNPGGSTMLHLELYGPGQDVNLRWTAGEAAPGNLINPRSYLIRAGGHPG